jgi:AP-3 complex subunit mu
MIQSLFILSPTGEILIERHFRGVTPRSVCDHFWERASVSLNHHGGVSTASTAIASDPLPLYDTVPPIMEIPMDHNLLHENKKTVRGEQSIFLFSILRDGLSYLAACPDEISPLLVIEFLHRIADMFVEYFGSPADESAIKDNFSTVYQLLEEMVDYGWPLMTEPNALQSIIRPPDVMGKVRVFFLSFYVILPLALFLFQCIRQSSHS